MNNHHKISNEYLLITVTWREEHCNTVPWVVCILLYMAIPPSLGRSLLTYGFMALPLSLSLSLSLSLFLFVPLYLLTYLTLRLPYNFLQLFLLTLCLHWSTKLRGKGERPLLITRHKGYVHWNPPVHHNNMDMYTCTRWIGSQMFLLWSLHVVWSSVKTQETGTNLVQTWDIFDNIYW